MASIIDGNYLRHSKFNCVDTGVYGKDHTMRLPWCIKMSKKDGIEKRKF